MTMKYAIVGVGIDELKIAEAIAKLCSEQGIREDEILVVSTMGELREFQEQQMMQEQFLPERMKPILIENLYAKLPEFKEVFYPPKIHPKHQQRQNSFKKKKKRK